MLRARTGIIRLATLVAAGALAVAGCGSSPSSSNDASGGSGNNNGGNNAAQVTLKVGLFGTFGFKEAGLYDQYMKLHPNVKIEESSVEEEQTYYQALQTHLGAGSGLADIQGIEVGRIADVVGNQATKWLDLNSMGAGDLKSTFYGWKWDAATTKDGAVLGLGTDTGPEAICYRSDLFKQAGLPTDRTTLAQKWSTWQGFIDLGKQYHAHAPKGSTFTDSAAGMFNAIIGQSQTQYYDASGNLVYENNPAVKSAWSLATQAAAAGITARLKQFDKPWNAAFANGAFATVACPAWMIGYIKGQAGTGSAGKWDVATLPGGGAGNWGGSYLGIPKASTHQKEAYDLLKWLTAPEQQVTMFTKEAHFPSSSTAASDPAVAKATDPYFSNAPIGELYGKAASATPPAFNGAGAATIKDQFSNALVSVEQQGKSADQAWSAALSGIKDALGN
jgi:cellobiose transport system substrate-binding protein